MTSQGTAILTLDPGPARLVVAVSGHRHFYSVYWDDTVNPQTGADRKLRDHAFCRRITDWQPTPSGWTATVESDL